MKDGSIGIWISIPRLNIPTFASLSKKIQTAKDEKIITIGADRDIFGRLLVVALWRKINMRLLLSHELNTVPYALAHVDGTLKKPYKSELLKELKKSVDVPVHLPSGLEDSSYAIINDLLPVIRALKTTGLDNFGQLADKLFFIFTKSFEDVHCCRVDVVHDEYLPNSIKRGERIQRGASRALEICINGPATPLPKQFSKYLTNNNNKRELCAFLACHWCECAKQHLQASKELVITQGKKAVMIRNKVEHVIGALESDQEEADFRLLLHAKHAAGTNECIIVKSVDSDVAIISLEHFHELGCQSLWFATGTAEHTRYIPVHMLAATLGQEVCNSILGLHSLTGCDTTSTFFGITKEKSLSVMVRSINHHSTLQKLGQEIDISDDLLEKVEAFVCGLYTDGSECEISKIDELRLHFFSKKGQRKENLPPTSKSLQHHILRANYQCYVWRHALTGIQDIPDPVGNGWEIVGNELVPVLLGQEAAPKGLIELTVCNCQKTMCAQGKCSCRANKLSCTTICNCMAGVECKNPETLKFDEAHEVADASVA